MLSSATVSSRPTPLSASGDTPKRHEPAARPFPYTEGASHASVDHRRHPARRPRDQDPPAFRPLGRGAIRGPAPDGGGAFVRGWSGEKQRRLLRVPQKTGAAMGRPRSASRVSSGPTRATSRPLQRLRAPRPAWPTTRWGPGRPRSSLATLRASRLSSRPSGPRPPGMTGGCCIRTQVRRTPEVRVATTWRSSQANCALPSLWARLSSMMKRCSCHVNACQGCPSRRRTVAASSFRPASR